MNRISIVALALLFLFFFSGCNDPLGATTRASIGWESRERIAQSQAQAEAAKAQAQLEAARAQANAKVEVAREERRASETWAATAPILFLILGGAIILAIATHWRGKTFYSVSTTQVQTAATLAIEERRRLALIDYAHETGADMIQGPTPGAYLLRWPDGSQRLYLPKPK